ncbi:hypothetical protein FDZ71_00715, partial [bacterium]
FNRWLKPVPSGRIACPTCHDPHSSQKKMLRGKGPEDICVKCHKEKTAMKRNIHYGGNADISSKNKGGGVNPVADGCVACHPPHAEKPLMRGLAKSGEPNETFCRSCHGEGMKPSPSHTMFGAPPWKMATVSLPLFNVDGKRSSKGFMTCPTCHNVHSDNRLGSFRKDPEAGEGICVTCHTKQKVIAGSSHDPKKRGSNRQCLQCHPVHAAEGDRPPVWELRVSGLGSWNDRKCISSDCHKVESLQNSAFHSKRSHPVNIVVDEKAMPSAILYDPWGRKGGKMVVCASCHNIHGTTDIDGTTIANFLRSPQAGGVLCGTCHQDKLSLLPSGHNMADKYPNAPCGPCHVAHKAKSDDFLWGVWPAKGPYRPNNLCRSCHTTKARPKNDPLMQYHMRDGEEALTERGTIYLQWPMFLIDPWPLKSDEEPAVPLFDQEGEIVSDGSLQCKSCHEPHTYTLPEEYTGEGKRNVDNKFLKLGDLRRLDYSVCMDCHEKETERHYLDYHKVWEDVGGEFNPGLDRPPR